MTALAFDIGAIPALSPSSIMMEISVAFWDFFSVSFKLRSQLLDLTT